MLICACRLQYVLGLAIVVPVPVALNPLAVLLISTPIFSVPNVLYIVYSKPLKKCFSEPFRARLATKFAKSADTCMGKIFFQQNSARGTKKVRRCLKFLDVRAPNWEVLYRQP